MQCIGKLYRIMATPTPEEIEEFYNEETEYQDPQDAFEDAYVEAVITGNEEDDDT